MTGSTPGATWRPIPRWLAPLALGLLVTAAAVLLRLADPAILERARLAVFDSYQQLSPRPYQAVPVRVVTIDDATLERLGQWPWPRDLVARLVERLNGLGAAAIALDMVLAEPDRASPSQLLPTLERHALLDQAAVDPARWPDYDRQLAETFGRARVITSFGLLGRANDVRPALKTGVAILGETALAGLPRYVGAVANLPALEAAGKGNGSITVLSESDKVIRQIPLLAALGDTIYPSLALETLRVAQGADSLAIRSGQATPGGLPRPASVRVGRVTVPMEDGGRFRLHYTGPVPERTLPAWRVLDQAADLNALAPLFRGHIVLVGFSAVGLSDLRATPLNPFEPGVNIHAEAIEQMLLGAGLSRPAWSGVLELLAGALAALLVVGLLIGRRARWGAGAALLAAGGAVAGSWLAYQEARLLLDPLFPAITAGAVYVVVSVLVHRRGERERRFMRSAFGQYLSPEFVDKLVDEPGRLVLGGESREMTFLFTDLQGFTAFVERSEPEKLVRILNAYIEGLCGIVMQQGGTVDKIVGDAVHAMFNAPLEQPDHPQRAVACALAIDAFACEFANALRDDGIDFGETRIGVNTGMAIVGNFGGESRFDYTAHGDSINTAARLEAANKLLGTRICVAQSTAGRTADIGYRALGAIPVAGRTEKIEVLEPLAETPSVYRAFAGTGGEPLRAGAPELQAALLAELGAKVETQEDARPSEVPENAVSPIDAAQPPGPRQARRA